MRVEERPIVVDLIRVVQDLDTTVFSSLERKLKKVRYCDAILTQQKINFREAIKDLRRALKDAPLSNSVNESLTGKEIPNLSPLELRVKLLCKQSSFAS